MDKKQIKDIIINALEDLNQTFEDDKKIVISDDVKLFGKEGQLDSMNLVALLIDIEDSLMEMDIQVELTSEDAMSKFRSPFRDIKSLTEYIATLINHD